MLRQDMDIGDALDVDAIGIQNTFGITEKDIENIRKCGQVVVPHLNDLVEEFYEWLMREETSIYFLSDKGQIDRLKESQKIYWKDFFECNLNENYFENRQQIGAIHASIELPLNLYMSAMSKQFSLIVECIIERSEKSEFSEGWILSLYRLCHLDEALTAEAYAAIVSAQLRRQSKSMMEMSTPVTLIWDGILVLPLVGIIDSRRAMDLITKALAEIGRQQARSFILDISGVMVMDTAVANYLTKITKATRLMGCETVISGLSAEVATTIVDLGIDVGEVSTTVTLKDALALAMGRSGLKVIVVEQ